MYDARRASMVAWIAIALMGCAVGATDVSSSTTSDAGADADELDASDASTNPIADAGAGGAGGSGGAGGAGGAGDDSPGSGGTGGSDNAGGSGGSGGGSGTCEPPSPTGQCDPFAQCGCNPGQNCIFTGHTDGRTQCVSAGSVPAFGACSSHDQCPVGYGCVSGICKPFCQTQGDCAAAQGDCGQLYVNENGSDVPIAHAKACSVRCDLQAPQAKCSGQGVSCVYMGDGTTDCIGGFGTATGYGACTSNWQNCAPGYLCIGGDCLRWCRVGYSDCPALQTCYELRDNATNSPILVYGMPYGVCDY